MTLARLESSLPPSLMSPSPETKSSATSRRDFAVIATLVVAAFIVILNETTINIAIPRLMTDLNVTESTAQWLATGFLLTTGIFIPTTGFLLQKFTTRTLFISAMAVFSLGLLIAGLAPAFPVLLLGRVVQALGMGLMMPLLMTVILALIPAERRGAAIGLVVVVIAVAPALGPTLAGLIMGVLSWRWIFLLILPIALGVLGYGAKNLVNVTEVRDPVLDVPSVFLSALAFGGIVFGFSRLGGEGGASGGPGPLAIGSLLVGAVTLAIFARRQLHLESPLLDLRAFRYKMFALAIVTMGSLTMSLFGSFMLLPLYLQKVRHFDPTHAGLVLLPGGVMLGIVSPISGRLFDRFGPRVLTLVGATCLVGSLASFSQATPSTPIALIIAMNCAQMLSMAMLMTPVQTTGLNQLPRRLYSHGNAINGTVQQVSGAIGTALIITVMTLRAHSLFPGVEKLSDEQRLAATAYGLHSAFGFAACIALVPFVLVLFLRRTTAPQPEASGAVEEIEGEGEPAADDLVFASH